MADIQKLISILGDSQGFAAALDEAEQQAKAAQARLQQIAEAADKADATLKGRARQRAFALLDQERRETERHITQIARQREQVENQVTAAAKKASQDRLKVAENEARERGRLETGAFRGVVRAGLQGTGLPLPFVTGGPAAIAGGLAGAATALLIRKAIQDNIDLANSITRIAAESQASVPQVAQFLAVTGKLGIDAGSVESALTSLRSAISRTPEQFEALGIALKNADGSARPLIDVFADVRRMLAGSADDSDTAQIATELLGGSYTDLIPLLGLSDEALASLNDQIHKSGEAMSQEAVDGAKAYQAALEDLGTSVGSVIRQLGEQLIPKLADVARLMLNVGDMTSRVGENDLIDNIPIASGIGHFYENLFDLAGGQNNANTRRLAQLDHARDEAAKAAAKARLGKKDGTQQGANTRSGMDAGRSAASDASRQHIQDLQDEKRIEDDRVKSVIDGIKDEQRAEQERHAAAVKAIDDQRDAKLAAIQATMDAEQEADHAADEAEQRRHINGEDTVSVLQARIDALNKIAAIEDEEQRKAEAAAHLADLERDAAHEASVQIYRSKSETEDQYQQRVYDQQVRAKQATDAVEKQKVAIAKDASKAALAAVIDGIQQQIKAEERKSALEKLDLAEQRRQRDAAHKHEIDQINAEATDAKAAEDAKTDAFKKTTDLRIAELDKQLKAFNDNVDAQIRAAERMVEGINAAVEKIVRNVNITVTASGATSKASPNSGANVLVPNFAAGGSITLNEPTVLMGLRSQRVLATAAMEGSEPVSFGGVGARASDGSGAGGPITVQLIADGKKLAEVVVPHVARGLGARYGYRSRP